MSTVFVIDGNWYLHRCFFTVKTNYDFSQKLCLSFLSLACKDALAVKASHLLIAFDGPHVFRYKKDPLYKANRSEHSSVNSMGISSSEIYKYLPDLFCLLTELGICYCQPEIFEADDVACSAAYKYSKVIVGTKDKDSFQYLSDKVSLYDSSFKKGGKPFPRFITYKDVEKLKGISISKMVKYQTLVGDKIDNIPSILSPIKTKNLLNKYGSIKNILKECPDQKVISSLKTNIPRLLLNKELVTLRKDVPLPELSSLKLEKKILDVSLKSRLPKSYFDYLDFIYPNTPSLFG